jgi:hypothetical protein
LNIGEPQREQNTRNRPGDDSNSRKSPAPETSRKSLLATELLQLNALPLARWHCLQWQKPIGLSFPFTS